MSAISTEFSAGKFYKNIEHTQWNMIYRTRDSVVYQLFPSTCNDYKRYVPVKSNGLTKIGIQYINESIEAFIYSILRSQARTKQSIYSNRASALETQQEFRKIVEDSVINYDTSVWIKNMNQAVTDSNVVLNIAVNPTLWLLLSNILLNKPIPEYNNKLKVSDASMKFGLNADINRVTIKKTKLDVLGNEKPKKEHQETVFKQNPVKTEETIKKTVDENDLIPLFTATGLVMYLITKYVLQYRIMSLYCGYEDKTKN